MKDAGHICRSDYAKATTDMVTVAAVPAGVYAEAFLTLGPS
jgi:hypothetical protein